MALRNPKTTIPGLVGFGLGVLLVLLSLFGVASPEDVAAGTEALQQGYEAGRGLDINWILTTIGASIGAGGVAAIRASDGEP